MSMRAILWRHHNTTQIQAVWLRGKYFDRLRLRNSSKPQSEPATLVIFLRPLRR